MELKTTNSNTYTKPGHSHRLRKDQLLFISAAICRIRQYKG